MDRRHSLCHFNRIRHQRFSIERLTIFTGDPFRPSPRKNSSKDIGLHTKISRFSCAERFAANISSNTLFPSSPVTKGSVLFSTHLKKCLTSSRYISLESRLESEYKSTHSFSLALYSLTVCASSAFQCNVPRVPITRH